jgi:nucleoside-diphosphate-sugar epimerase
VGREFPLPLGAIRNKRSLIGLDNLVSAILLASEHRAAAGQTFLVSDQRDLSTPELLRAIASASGARLRLLPVPPALLRLAGRLGGRSGEIARLTGSLEIDSRAITRALGWRPDVSVEEGIATMVRG